MVDRDACINTINKFIRNKQLDTAIVLLEYLCDIKNLPNKKEAIEILSNPALISMLIPRIIEELEIELHLTRLEKNNTLILVY